MDYDQKCVICRHSWNAGSIEVSEIAQKILKGTPVLMELMLLTHGVKMRRDMSSFLSEAGIRI